MVDVSMTDGAHAMLALPLARHSIDGHSVARGSELLGGDAVPCYRVYACKGGTHVSVGALEPHFWARLCETVGLEEHAKAGLHTGDAGVAVGEALQAKLMDRYDRLRRSRRSRWCWPWPWPWPWRFSHWLSLALTDSR